VATMWRNWDLKAGGRNPDRRSHPASHGDLPILVGDGAALYVGFSHRITCALCARRDAYRDPEGVGVAAQCTFWRFLASLHLGVARQLLQLHRRCESGVGGGHVRLTSITLDTDTTVHTLYGRQMGGRKSYNPKNKGKRAISLSLPF